MNDCPKGHRSSPSHETVIGIDKFSKRLYFSIVFPMNEKASWIRSASLYFQKYSEIRIN
jgi:hypothetical protein